MSRVYQLAPSILSADFNRLGEQIQRVEKAECRWLHIDIMDGMFVPSISFGMPVVKSIRKESSLYFDVHMMVKDPERYVEEFQSCGADMITVHAEACRDLAETVKKIHETGADAGVAVNPDTPLSAVTDVMDQVEMILIMSVYPGFGGQKYIPESTERIRTLRRMLDEKGLEHVHIQVDGGINRATIDEVLAAGANIIVAGSAVFGSNIEQNVRELQEKILHTAKRQNKIQKDRKKRQGNVRTCIISGGMIEPDFAFPYLQKQQFDIILAADRGLEFCYHYQIIPTYILGDFDSLSPEILNYYKENHVAPIREFNPMKDNTDTDIAFQQAIVLGSSEITILGATGGRLDHFLSIVQNLKTAWEKKIPAYIVDSRNLITIPVETSFEIRKEEQFGKYVSFFPLEKEVASITLEGFAYPLDHHYLPNTSGGLCVSNEIVEETAHVSYEGGILLMVQSRD